MPKSTFWADNLKCSLKATDVTETMAFIVKPDTIAVAACVLKSRDLCEYPGGETHLFDRHTETQRHRDTDTAHTHQHTHTHTHTLTRL